MTLALTSLSMPTNNRFDTTLISFKKKKNHSFPSISGYTTTEKTSLRTIMEVDSPLGPSPTSYPTQSI